MGSVNCGQSFFDKILLYGIQNMSCMITNYVWQKSLPSYEVPSKQLFCYCYANCEKVLIAVNSQKLNAIWFIARSYSFLTFSSL